MVGRGNGRTSGGGTDPPRWKTRSEQTFSLADGLECRQFSRRPGKIGGVHSGLSSAKAGGIAEDDRRNRGMLRMRDGREVSHIGSSASARGVQSALISSKRARIVDREFLEFGRRYRFSHFEFD